MEMVLNVFRWRSMSALHIKNISDKEYNLYFKANSIKYSVLNYVDYMMYLHGGKYAGFINAFGTQVLKTITERRFKTAYAYSIREDDYDNVLTSSQLKDAKLKYGYFNGVYHYFHPNPDITDLTTKDLTIAGNQTVIIPRSSLHRRLTQLKNLVQPTVAGHPA